MALNLSPEKGVKLTKKDKTHIFKKNEAWLESNLFNTGIYF